MLLVLLLFSSLCFAPDSPKAECNGHHNYGHHNHWGAEQEDIELTLPVRLQRPIERVGTYRFDIPRQRRSDIPIVLVSRPSIVAYRLIYAQPKQ